MFFLKKFAQEMLGAGAPLLVTLYSKPAFLLEKVEKDNLTQKFFGKINFINIFFLKFLINFRIFFNNIIKWFLELYKELTVLFKKLLGNTFNAKSFF